jgi:fused signal recognition particle receptor
MAFSIFGKRNDPDSDPQPPQEPRGLFDRMKQAVTRTRESLGNSIASVVALTREVDEVSLDDLEFALLAADIGAPTAGLIIGRLRDRALRHGIADGAELKRLLKAEILTILSAVDKPLPLPATPPEVIMMVGVNGTGKTTTTGKLAAFYRAPSTLGPARTVLLCAADTFRAAAIEQLEVWAQRSGVDMISTRQGGDPSAALFDAATAAKARGVGVLLVDTAGRLHTKLDLMKELDKMRRTAEKLIAGAPHQTLLVIDATTGQNGLQQARLFTEAAHVTGIVLTKLDGSAKGGIVVAIAHELGLPVRFAGTGEKLEDLIPFDANAFVDSLLD